MDRCLLILFVIILIFVIIDLEFLFNSIENSESISLITIQTCPQYPANSKRYFQVNFTEEKSIDYTKYCSSYDTLLVYILSKIDDFNRREFIRQTWANKNQYEQLFRTCFIFVLGRTDNLKINAKIHNEILTYGDIVQVNINETYRNIVYKEVGALKWSHLYAAHIPYLFKTDDNVMVDSLLLSDITKYFLENRLDHSEYMRKHEEMKDFIKQMEEVDKYTLFKGVVVTGKKTIRQGKFGLHYVAWNHEFFPDYCRGLGYLLSGFVRDRLYRASTCYALDYVPWVSDLFVSGSLASAAAVRCGDWSMEYIDISDECSNRFASQPRLLSCSISMHLRDSSFDDYKQSWESILRRHGVTNRTIEKAKKRRLEVFKEEFEQRKLVEESIIEQIENQKGDKFISIMPDNKREDKLDEDS